MYGKYYDYHKNMVSCAHAQTVDTRPLFRGGCGLGTRLSSALHQFTELVTGLPESLTNSLNRLPIRCTDHQFAVPITDLLYRSPIRLNRSPIRCIAHRFAQIGHQFAVLLTIYSNWSPVQLLGIRIVQIASRRGMM